MKRFVSKSRLLKSGSVFVLIGGLAGCGQSLPVDPQGTLETVHAEGLRVGLSPNGDFVNVQDDPYTGSEVELAQDFAESLGVEVTWVIGGEEHLVTELEEGRVDLVAGGITEKTPWLEQVGVTRPYREIIDSKGKKTKLVLLVPPGENSFLSELEYFLDETQEMP